MKEFLGILLLSIPMMYFCSLVYLLFGFLFCLFRCYRVGIYLLCGSMAGDLFNLWSKPVGRFVVEHCNSKCPSKCMNWTCPHYESCKSNKSSSTE